MRKKSTSSVIESQKSARQFVYQRSNQKEGSPYYVFLYSEDDQSEDEDQFPLKARKGSQISPRKIEVINVQVQSEDTLQALALRYDCKISELKRINKIHKDNEIHAHQTIKVPVKPYSLLTETIEKNNQVNQIDIDANSKVRGTVSTEKEIIDSIGIPTCSTSSTIEINNIILNSVVEPLPQFHNECEIIEEETDQLISSTEYNNNNVSYNFVNTFKCSGADWGLSWFQLLCFSLILGFAGPIIYVLYIAESSKHHNPS